MKDKKSLKYLLEMMSKIDSTYPGENSGNDDEVNDVVDNTTVDGPTGDDNGESPEMVQGNTQQPSNQDGVGPIVANKQNGIVNKPHHVERDGNMFSFDRGEYQGPSDTDKKANALDTYGDFLKEDYVDSFENLKKLISLSGSFKLRHFVIDANGNLTIEKGNEIPSYDGSAPKNYQIIQALSFLFSSIDMGDRENSPYQRLKTTLAATPPMPWIRSFFYAYAGTCKSRDRIYSTKTRKLVFDLFRNEELSYTMNESNLSERNGDRSRKQVNDLEFSPYWDYPSDTTSNYTRFFNTIIEKMFEVLEKNNASGNKIKQLLDSYKNDNYDDNYAGYIDEFEPGTEMLRNTNANSMYEKLSVLLNIFSTSLGTKLDYSEVSDFNSGKNRGKGSLGRLDVDFNKLVSLRLKKLQMASNIYNQLANAGIDTISIQDIYSEDETNEEMDRIDGKCVKIIQDENDNNKATLIFAISDDKNILTVGYGILVKLTDGNSLYGYIADVSENTVSIIVELNNVDSLMPNEIDGLYTSNGNKTKELIHKLWLSVKTNQNDKVKTKLLALLKIKEDAQDDEIEDAINGFQLETITKDGIQRNITTMYDFLIEFFTGKASSSKFQDEVKKSITENLQNSSWTVYDEIGRNTTSVSDNESKILTNIVKQALGNQKSIDMTLIDESNNIVFIECQGDSHYKPTFTKGLSMEKMTPSTIKMFKTISGIISPSDGGVYHASATAEKNEYVSRSMIADNVSNTLLGANEKYYYVTSDTDNKVIGTYNEVMITNIVRLLLQQASDKQKFMALDGKEININDKVYTTHVIYVKTDRIKKDGKINLPWPEGDLVWNAASIPFITQFSLSQLDNTIPPIQNLEQAQLNESNENKNSTPVNIYANTTDWSQRVGEWEKRGYGEKLCNFIRNKIQPNESVEYIQNLVNETLYKMKNRMR